MKHFNKKEYTLGPDGLYRRRVQFGCQVKILVRDERGDLIRTESEKPVRDEKQL